MASNSFRWLHIYPNYLMLNIQIKTLFVFKVTVDYTSTPSRQSLTSSSVSVSWPQSGDVPRGLESYYQYVVEAADGHDTKEVTRPFIAGQASQTADITGLKHNTNYHIKVRIDATHNKETKGGNAGPSLAVKTACVCKYEYYFQCGELLPEGA